MRKMYTVLNLFTLIIKLNVQLELITNIKFTTGNNIH